MLTNRRTPFSSSRRSRMPGCLRSKSSMTSPTVLPLAFTSSAPPVSVRNGVGMRTVVSITRFSSLARACGINVGFRFDTAYARGEPAQRAIVTTPDGAAAHHVRLPVERHELTFHSHSCRRAVDHRESEVHLRRRDDADD